MRTVRFPAVFLSILLAGLVLPVGARAAGGAIDTSTADAGYFTVSYDSSRDAKMEVGVTHGADTVYYSYVPGDSSAYALPDGNGALFSE